MVGKFAGAVLTGLAAAALGACMSEQVAQDSPAYQAPGVSMAMPANAACYSNAELGAVRARMTQQIFATGVLRCRAAGGAGQQYTDFVGKFRNDLSANARELQGVLDRRQLNMDTLVTEMANRTAGRFNEPGFCARLDRALKWSLSPKVTALQQVPPPYDFGPEMRMFPCQQGRA